jgi:hypothetical protein
MKVNVWRQKASNDPLPFAHVVVEPQGQKKYKTKKGNEKDVAVEELVIVA